MPRLFIITIFLKVFILALKWTLVRSCFALCDFKINFSHASQQYWSLLFSLFIIDFSCFVVFSDIVVNVGSASLTASGGLTELVPRTWSAIFLLCFFYMIWPVRSSEIFITKFAPSVVEFFSRHSVIYKVRKWLWYSYFYYFYELTIRTFVFSMNGCKECVFDEKCGFWRWNICAAVPDIYTLLTYNNWTL
jgi:hypothetical protein